MRIRLGNYSFLRFIILLPPLCVFLFIFHFTPPPSAAANEKAEVVADKLPTIPARTPFAKNQYNVQGEDVDDVPTAREACRALITGLLAWHNVVSWRWG